eukprot:1157564-Pelagomonas_calceolata.AAC.2
MELMCKLANTSHEAGAHSSTARHVYLLATQQRSKSHKEGGFSSTTNRICLLCPLVTSRRHTHSSTRLYIAAKRHGQAERQMTASCVQLAAGGTQCRDQCQHETQVKQDAKVSTKHECGT